MTQPPELHPDESARLAALRALNVVETPLEERFERLTRMARTLLGVDIAAISLIEAQRQCFKSIQGLDVSETSRDVSFCGHAILGDDAMIVPDARLDERFANNPLVTGPPNIVAYVAVPLWTSDGYKVGTICAIHSEPRKFGAAEVQHLSDIAAIAQVELQVASANAVQASLIEEVNVERRRALIDPLTRVWNREGIMQLADESVSAGGPDGVALVMVDLDRFKQINDTLGHAAGDKVLRVAARRMLCALRETDVVGRVGGDEFLCMLSPCADAGQADEVAERVRAQLSAEPITTDAGQVDVTASFGVTLVRPGERVSLKDALESADQAMYACKRDGRDGVSFDGPQRDAA